MSDTYTWAEVSSEEEEEGVNRLFEPDRLIGMFKGFTEEGLEFRAEIVSPYQPSEELTPRIGQFLLVELGSPDEAALGRITRFFPVGVLAGREGDEYLAEMQRSNNEVPAQLKESRLRYNVKVRLLGGLRLDHRSGGRRPLFIPTVRKLPHLGARVALPGEEILSFLCNLGAQTDTAQPIGYFSLGEIIYNGGESTGEDFLLPQPQSFPVNFDVKSLISRRSFIFARAGYGKSNMLKLLISQLYADDGPKDRSDRSVGMLVLDPEGEYFWPDEDRRPGLCNVPHLKDKVAVFTDRLEPNPYYGSWKIGGIRLDVRELRPSDVVSLCIPEDRQNQQNVAKLRGLQSNQWRQLIDYVAENGHNADEKQIQTIAGFRGSEGVEARAMRSNIVTIVNRLHDPDGTLQTQVAKMLAEGMIVVVDLSLVTGSIGLQISGLLLKSIFDYNQYNFTSSGGGTGIIPTIAVLEEAQSVLSRRASDESPFVQWVKEGRKYGLGAIMVTQQPGSMAPELLSQGDNFFTFHLLSANDLKTLQQHNAHFSDDILASVLNEPIKGNFFFWSAPDQPFVLSARILNFDTIGTDVPGAQHITAPLDVRANRFQGEVREAELGLATAVRETITSTSTADGKGVEFYGLPNQHSSRNTYLACYKPRLSIQAAKKLDEDSRARFCGSREGQFVQDQHLENALKKSGIVAEVKRVEARRSDGKAGDYYLIPLSVFDGQEPRIRETLSLKDDK